MRRRIAVMVGSVLVVLIAGAPAQAATPQASCVGQEVAELAPALGSEFGAVVAFEARNPGLEGRKSFGEEISGLAAADRSACPTE